MQRGFKLYTSHKTTEDNDNLVMLIFHAVSTLLWHIF